LGMRIDVSFEFSTPIDTLIATWTDLTPVN